MPIRYRCDSCSQLLSIATKMAGLSVPCPRCGTPNIVPAPGTPLDAKSGKAASASTATPPVVPASVSPPGARPALPPLPPIPATTRGTSGVSASVLSPVSPPPAQPISQSPAQPVTPLPPMHPHEGMPSTARDASAGDAAADFPEQHESTAGNFLDDAEFERTMLSSGEDFRPMHQADDTILQPATDDEPAQAEQASSSKARRSTRKRESAATESDSAPAAAFSLSRRGRNSEDEEMDLTPMVDMTFLLLIFFMITASFSMQKSISFPAPGAEKKGASQQLQSLEDLEEKAIIVRIDEQNAILVEDEPVGDVRQLASRFRNLMRSSGQNELVVTAADAAFHETVVKVIDAANDAGVERIRLGATADE